MNNEVAVLIRNGEEIRMRLYETESKVAYGYEMFKKLKGDFIAVLKDYEQMKPISKKEYEEMVDNEKINWFFMLNLNSKKLTIQTTYSDSDNNEEFPLEEFELNKINSSSMEKYFNLIDRTINQLED